MSVMTRPAMVTVCLPTRNRAHYLADAVASVLAQTFSDFDLWIWDNASQDSTEELVRSLADPRVRYVRRDADAGLAANWMDALRAARGTYCAVLGDDDLWEPTFLERLVAPLQADAAVDIAFADHWIIDRFGAVLAEETEACSRGYTRASLRPGRHQPFRSLVLKDQAILINAAVMRRSRLITAQALDARSGRVLDYHILGKLAALGGGAFYVPERLYRYRRHPGTMTASEPIEIWRDMQWVCADLHRSAAGDDALAVREQWVRAIVSEAVASLRLHGRRAMAGSLGRALWRVPVSARGRVGVDLMGEVFRRVTRPRVQSHPAGQGVASANP
jgi:glycosyltransferase involved in cell wall biosynthesis